MRVEAAERAPGMAKARMEPKRQNRVLLATRQTSQPAKKPPSTRHSCAGSARGVVSALGRLGAAALGEDAFDAEDAELSNVDPREAARRAGDPVNAIDIPTAGAGSADTLVVVTALALLGMAAMLLPPALLASRSSARDNGCVVLFSLRLIDFR